MNNEELGLLKNLQPFFRERMGKWQQGDWGLDQYGNRWLFTAEDDATDYDEFLNYYVDISNDAAGWVIRTGTFGNTNHYFVDTLTLALLKALAHQEGVEP